MESQPCAVAPLLPTWSQADDLIGFTQGVDKVLGVHRETPVLGRENVARSEHGLVEPELAAAAHDCHESSASEEPAQWKRQAHSHEPGPPLATRPRDEGRGGESLHLHVYARQAERLRGPSYQVAQPHEVLRPDLTGRSGSTDAILYQSTESRAATDSAAGILPSAGAHGRWPAGARDQ